MNTFKYDVNNNATNNVSKQEEEQEYQQMKRNIHNQISMQTNKRQVVVV